MEFPQYPDPYATGIYFVNQQCFQASGVKKKHNFLYSVKYHFSPDAKTVTKINAFNWWFLCHSSSLRLISVLTFIGSIVNSLEVPASYRVVPLTSTDTYLLITVKISLNPSDEEEMTSSTLQMQHNLINKPRCGWSCVKSVSVCACRRRWKTGTTCIKNSPRDVSEEMWRCAGRI